MRIVWAEICRDIREHDEGTDLIGVQTDTAHTSQFPCTVQALVAVAVAFRYEEIEDETVHELAGWALNADLEQISQKLVLRLPLRTPDADFPLGWEGHGIEPMPMSFVAWKEGMYALQFQLDDEEPLTIPIRVKASHSN